MTVLATLGCDRLSKTAAVRLLAGRAPVEILGGLLRFRLAENRGAFLGLGGRLPESLRFTAFVTTVGLALATAFVWLVMQRSLPARRSFAVAMMLGGGFANLLDRIPDGSVTDFLVVGAGRLHTGVFNLADAAIVAGALLWFLPRREGRRRRSPSCGA